MDGNLRRRKSEYLIWRGHLASKGLKPLYKIAIKGPLTTPVGGGRRSFKCNAAPELRFICMSTTGEVVSWRTLPVRNPELVDMVVFRENSEDIYAGIEWAADSPEAKQVISLQNEMGVNNIRYPDEWDGC